MAYKMNHKHSAFPFKTDKQDKIEKENTTSYKESQNYTRVKNSRKGTRKNPNGTESTHLMADDNVNTAYPTLFQDKDGNFYPGNKKEAKRKDEVYKFDSKKEMTDFARKGNWKNN
tara:strand:+ start:224 stop:568 length:345 start_codon:yes stop_codon:yes gene_type:complete